MKMKRIMIAAGLAVALCGAAFGSVEMEQKIRLERGWNAFHVEVADTNDVDTLFRDWPVNWVALYDPAAFLETRQYSAESSNEGASRAGYRMWRRNAKGLNGFDYVPADSVLVCYVSNTAHTCTFRGAPCAPRISWHRSDHTNDLNLVGFSTWGDTTTQRYFSGLNVGDASFFVFGGNDTTKPMVMPTTLAGETSFSNAQVLAVSSPKVSDWSGVLNVSPRNGLDFGTEGAKAMLEIRNDGAEARQVRVHLVSGESPTLEERCLHVRDALTALTNDAWSAFSAANDLEKTLAAGETWELQFALDRKALPDSPGTVHGAVLSISDISEDGSRMCVCVPIQATNDGGASSAYAWPKGVWLAAAELDKVSFFLTKEGGSTGKEDDFGVHPAGGKMKVRLPLYVDENGVVTLLQRFWYGRDTNGVLRAYSGAVETSDVPLYDVKRVSSACLPADQPVLGKTDAGAFGKTARFDFTVGETSNVNPMRHAPHPRHDGLMADYGGPTPSGDVLAHYAQTVKPESFSVTNRIEFTWERTQATSWNPEETLTGTLKWEFDGIRHERTIQAQGRFSMKRLSPVSMKME